MVDEAFFQVNAVTTIVPLNQRNEKPAFGEKRHIKADIGVDREDKI